MAFRYIFLVIYNNMYYPPLSEDSLQIPVVILSGDFKRQSSNQLPSSQLHICNFLIGFYQVQEMSEKKKKFGKRKIMGVK